MNWGVIGSIAGIIGVGIAAVALLFQVGVLGGDNLEIRAINPEEFTLAQQEGTISVTGRDFSQATKVILETSGSPPVTLARSIGSETQISATLNRIGLSTVFVNSNSPQAKTFSVCVQDSDDGKRSCLNNALNLLVLPADTSSAAVPAPTPTQQAAVVPTPPPAEAPSVEAPATPVPPPPPAPTATPIPPPTSTPIPPPTATPRPAPTATSVATNLTGFYFGEFVINIDGFPFNVEMNMNITQTGNRLSGTTTLGPLRDPSFICGLVQDGEVGLSTLVPGAIFGQDNFVFEGFVDSIKGHMSGEFSQFAPDISSNVVELYPDCFATTFGALINQGTWSVSNSSSGSR